jgi:ABC-type Zn uptake system ZnuABC Zn-binding protein ZnuA
MPRGVLILLIIGLGILSIISLKKTYQEYAEPKIAVTIYPFYDITQEIVGDKFKVILITPPGAEPHNFELRPEDLKKLRGVKIVFANGLLIDNWVENILKNFPGVKIVRLADSAELIDNDPHFWLSLENMKKIAQKIEIEIENFDPQNKSYYQQNLNNVLNKLNQLSQLAKEFKPTFPYLITQHNAFNYLAKELNLNIIGYLESANKELTPEELKSLIDKIRLLNLKVIFKEPGEESNLLKTIAREYNLKIYELDPIEGKSDLNYFEAYRKNIETLKEVLK